MAKGGMIHEDIFNEVDGTDPEKPDSNGNDLYFGGYSEPLDKTLTKGPMLETPNSKATRDLYGGPSKGEPNPAGQKGN